MYVRQKLSIAVPAPETILSYFGSLRRAYEAIG